MFAMAMHCRLPALSYLQRINTCVAVRYHANNALLDFFNKSSITYASSTKPAMLDMLGKFSMNGIVKSIQRGSLGKLTVDNIDGLTIARQIRCGKGNVSYHYTASTYIVE
jgi:hypothetical protein